MILEKALFVEPELHESAIDWVEYSAACDLIHAGKPGLLLERVNADYLKLRFNRVYDRPESEFSSRERTRGRFWSAAS